MAKTVIKGKRYSFVFNEDESYGTRISKLHKEFASMELNLSRYAESGVSLWIEDHVCTPREVAHYCFDNASPDCVPDHVTDSDGNLIELHFNIL